MNVALIPARGGSKRLPGKNIMPLNGKPLIAHTIDAALAAKSIDRVIVSTDDPQIAEVAKQYGADVPFMRDATLATDTASSNDVMLDLLARFEGIQTLVLLQPTSPLRSSADIDAAMQLLTADPTLEGVVSVSPSEHPPIWSQPLGADDSMGEFAILHSPQHSPQQSTVRLNGALYAFRRTALLANGGIRYSEQVRAYVMPVERAVDIDTLLDFRLAETLLADNAGANHGE